jgi:hypothetical protein
MDAGVIETAGGPAGIFEQPLLASVVVITMSKHPISLVFIHQSPWRQNTGLKRFNCKPNARHTWADDSVSRSARQGRINRVAGVKDYRDNFKELAK